jgi:hypothetical protein
MTYVNNKGGADMPRRDGTGPMGVGPMTGRGLGWCTGVNAGWYGAGFGLGLACRRGFGRWFGRGYAVNPYINLKNVNTPRQMLEMQKEMLQNSLDAINKQLQSHDETQE